jgi:hypothetical protein
VNWPGLLLGVLVLAISTGGLAWSLRALRSGDQASSPVGPTLAILIFSLVDLAGVLFVLYSLNLSGNLGR